MALIAIASIGILQAQARAQNPSQRELTAKDSAYAIGVKECAACHSAPSPIYDLLGVTKFVRLVEAEEWLTRDKHAYAYQLVKQDLTDDELTPPKNRSNQLSIAICKKLGWGKNDEQFQKKCLTCHAGVDASNSTRPDFLRQNLQFGIQCEACHGPGSQYTQVDQHQQDSWRAKTGEQKSKLGMIDLTSPSACAEVCMSCHVGNKTQNRFVSHAMYVAGHPPLPPFDLQTFLDAMPPHWQTISEKGSFAFQKEYYAAHYDIDPTVQSDKTERAIQSSFARTQRSMIGGLVANDLGIQMIHTAASQSQSDPEKWGDFSMYNCMGCHQELRRAKLASNLRDRIPGRPFPADWLFFEHDSVHKTNAAKQGALSKELFASFNQVPFGDSKKISQLSESHRESLADRLRDRRALERKIMRTSDVQQWLQVLLANRQDKLNDYWVAKQTSWMVSVAANELVEHGTLNKEQVETRLKELSDLLQLDIAISQKASVLDSQEKTLKLANQFDAQRCQLLIQELVEIARGYRMSEK